MMTCDEAQFGDVEKTRGAEGSKDEEDIVGGAMAKVGVGDLEGEGGGEVVRRRGGDGEVECAMEAGVREKFVGIGRS